MLKLDNEEQLTMKLKYRKQSKGLPLCGGAGLEFWGVGAGVAATDCFPSV